VPKAFGSEDPAREFSTIFCRVWCGISLQIKRLNSEKGDKVMKIRNLLMSFFLVTALAFTAFANTNPIITFSGTDYFDPFNILGMGAVGAILPSEVTVLCPGYEPTGDPLMPCPEGSRTHLRNSKVMTRYISNTPGFPSGWFTIVVNYNLDADYNGPAWGTFTLELEDGGVVTGRWQGVRYKEEDHWILPLQVTARIEGGTFDGSTMVASDRITEYTPAGIAYIGQVEGKILGYR
jgi:hypothetical protein